MGFLGIGKKKQQEQPPQPALPAQQKPAAPSRPAAQRPLLPSHVGITEPSTWYQPPSTPSAPSTPSTPPSRLAAEPLRVEAAVALEDEWLNAETLGMPGVAGVPDESEDYHDRYRTRVVYGPRYRTLADATRLVHSSQVRHVNRNDHKRKPKPRAAVSKNKTTRR